MSHDIGVDLVKGVGEAQSAASGGISAPELCYGAVRPAWATGYGADSAVGRAR